MAKELYLSEYDLNFLRIQFITIEGLEAKLEDVEKQIKESVAVKERDANIINVTHNLIELRTAYLKLKGVDIVKIFDRLRPRIKLILEEVKKERQG